MPPPSSENDLKRLARRRLIGAVALILLAVIVLPLLLEDEPPPASSLAVHMAAASPDQVVQPDPVSAPDELSTPESPPLAQPAPPVEPANPTPKSPSKPEPIKPEPIKPEPVKPEPVKPVSAPLPQSAGTPAPQARPAVGGDAFVVQLAALSDAGKAQALKARAAAAGLPAYTDTVGALTRVRVGPYSSREAAVAAAVKLAENGISGQILTK